MKEKRECEIVQDLLPNYMENLTSIQTNEYIEEHIANCGKCKRVLENMQKEVPTDEKVKNKKEVKYMKKYRNKMRILSFILLAIFLVFIGTTTRKAIILADLAQKAEETAKSTNYHMTIYSYEKGRAYKDEAFVLKDKRKSKSTLHSEQGTSINQNFIYQKEGKEAVYNVYRDDFGKKTAHLNCAIDIHHEQIGWKLPTPLRTENIVHLLLNAVITSIQTRTLNGEECYLITNFKGNYVGVYDGAGIYINKENGLMIAATECEVDYSDGIRRIEIGNEIEYEFGIVTEEDLIEPDISEYEVQK